MSKTHKKYTGNLLIANPANPLDELEKSVLLIVTHTDQLGVAIQLNNVHDSLKLDEIAHGVGIEDFPSGIPVYFGGNMNQSKIHVVHSLDWQSHSTVALTPDIGITNDVSILAAISQGQGPEMFKSCTGYWIWDDGRLDIQLNARNRSDEEPHKWEILPATLDNVFGLDPEIHWHQVIDDSVNHKVKNWI